MSLEIGGIEGGGYPVILASNILLGSSATFNPQNIAITSENAPTLNLFTAVEYLQGQINAGGGGGGGDVTAVNGLTGSVSLNQTSSGGIGFTSTGSTSGNFYLDSSYSPTFAGLTLSNLTQGGVVTVDSGLLSSLAYTSSATVNTIVSRDSSGNSSFGNIYAGNVYVGTDIDVEIPDNNLTIGAGAANLNIGSSTVNINFKNITAAGAIIANSSGQISSLAYGSSTVASTLVERDSFGNFHGEDIYADGSFYSEGFDSPSPITIINIGASIADTINLGNSGSSLNLKNISSAGALVANSSGLVSSLVYTNLATASTIMSRDSSGNTNINDLTANIVYTEDIDTASEDITLNIGNTNATTINIGNASSTTNFSGTVTGINQLSLYAHLSLSPGLDQVVLTIATNVILYYSGTNQQFYISNTSGSTINYVFSVEFTISPDLYNVSGNSVLSLADSTSAYLTEDSTASTGYDISTAGYAQRIVFLNITVGSTIYQLQGIMTYDGTYNNILVYGA